MVLHIEGGSNGVAISITVLAQRDLQLLFVLYPVRIFVVGNMLQVVGMVVKHVITSYHQPVRTLQYVHITDKMFMAFEVSKTVCLHNSAGVLIG